MHDPWNQEVQDQLKSAVSVNRLRRACKCLGLENAQILDKYTDEQLAEGYNGIGPDRFPEWLVSALDSLSPELLPACMIHDVEWIESDGTRESFHDSNGRLRRNGKITAKAMYGFWNLKRYIVMWKARTFAKVCEKFGYNTWRQYHEGRRAGIESNIKILYNPALRYFKERTT